MGGIFTLDEERIQEKRLFHSSDFLIKHLNIHSREQLIACTTEQQDGTANIGIMPVNGSKPNDITEGDSLDLAPYWLPGKNKALVYQSAGIARNSQGFVVERSPFRIEKLDFDAQTIDCLLEDANYDFLKPQMTADGSLYYIRRPYNKQSQQISVWGILKDILLLPLRLANTVYQILNFFAVTFTGKPLMKVGEAKPSDKEQKMQIWGELIDLQKLSRDKNLKEGDAPALVPDTWELMCKTPNGIEKAIAKGVLYYDITKNGSLIYTNGNRIYYLADSIATAEKLFDCKLVEQLTLLVEEKSQSQ